MSEQMRLNKALAELGICSRRDADKLILAGDVCVDAKRVTELGTKVTIGSQIMVRGEGYKCIKAQTKVWIFNKPAGLVTTHDDEKGRPTVFDYLQTKINERVISIGRLDLNSEGLLLLTNDGAFARFAESPKTGWERKYRVRIFGTLAEDAITELRKGATVDEIKYAPIIVEKLGGGTGKNQWIACTLHEGKNREIRKALAHYGVSVNRLIRTKYGEYELGDLARGDVRLAEVSKEYGGNTRNKPRRA